MALVDLYGVFVSMLPLENQSDEASIQLYKKLSIPDDNSQRTTPRYHLLEHTRPEYDLAPAIHPHKHAHCHVPTH